MAIRSSLITAPVTADKYILTNLSGINTEDVVVDAKAQQVYERILIDYANIQKKFSQLSTQLTKAKSKVKGSKLKQTITKAAKRVQDQGKYCSNRARDLKDAFAFSEIEAKVRLLEEELAKATNKANSEGK